MSRMDESLMKLESILFSYGGKISEKKLSNYLNIKNVRKKLSELQKIYSERETSLQVINEGSNWQINVKNNYINLVKNFVEKTEMDAQTLETLSVIAFKNPVLQSEVVRLRNPSAYDHIKHLQELGFIIKEKKGRSYLLKLTSKFFEYFDVPKNKVGEFFSNFKEKEEEVKGKEEETKKEKEQEEEEKKRIEKEKQHQQLNNFN